MDTNNEANIPIIEKSTDYKRFKLSGYNRPIDMTHVQNLAEQMSKNPDLLAVYPSIVDAGDTILDGQHRFLAARQVGAPYYFIRQNVEVEAIVGANLNTRQWKGADFMAHYCAMGLPEYLKLAEFLTRWPITIGVVLRMSSAWKANTKRFRLGQFVFDEQPTLEIVCQHIAQIENAIVARDKRWLWSRAFVSAVKAMLALPGYSQTRMLRQIDKQPANITRQIRTEDCLRQMQEIYNRDMAAKNRVLFF